MKNKLTNKQKIFVREYQIDFNATAAARRAGYSAKNADKIGYNLIENSRVSAEINLQMAGR